MESSITVSTDREVASLRPSPDGKVVWAVVEGCPGLRVRVTAGRKGASKAFCYRYRAPDGRQEMKVIGHYQIPGFGLREARAQWRELREIRETHGYVKTYVAQERAQNVAAIEATTKQTDRDAYTVAVLAREFVDFQSAKIKTWRETQRNLNVYVLPEIGDRPANGVRRKDVLEILDGLTRKGNTVTANRVLAAARAMFNWAIQREKAAIESNPCIAIKPQKEQARERALSDVELRRLLVNAPDSTLTSDERDLLDFILLTACRLSEATGARLTAPG